MRTTLHADLRARKRIGVASAEKMFEEALQFGIKQNELKGDLKRFINKSAMEYRSTPIIYKGYVFWHKGEILITIIPLHHKWNKYTKAILEKRDESLASRDR